MYLVYVAKLDSRLLCNLFHEKTLETNGGWLSAAQGGPQWRQWTLHPREKLTLEQKDVPKGRFDLVKNLQRSKLQADPVALWRRQQAGAVHDESQPMAGTGSGEVHE